MLSQSLTSVAVHPLVLLSVIDHYNRVCRSTSKYVHPYVYHPTVIFDEMNRSPILRFVLEHF